MVVLVGLEFTNHIRSISNVVVLGFLRDLLLHAIGRHAGAVHERENFVCDFGTLTFIWEQLAYLLLFAAILDEEHLWVKLFQLFDVESLEVLRIALFLVLGRSLLIL